MPDYKLILGTHVRNGVRYTKGDVIRNLSNESASRIGLHRLQRVSSTPKEETDDLQEETNAWTAYLDENRAPEILEKLGSDDLDLTDLESILAAEQSGQKRVTILRRVKERIAQKKTAETEEETE